MAPLPPEFWTEAEWIDQCMAHPNGTRDHDAIDNFFRVNQWNFLLIGEKGTGIFFHKDHVSENDEFCIKNEELCIKNEEFCINVDEFCSSPRAPGRCVHHLCVPTDDYGTFFWDFFLRRGLCRRPWSGASDGSSVRMTRSEQKL